MPDAAVRVLHAVTRAARDLRRPRRRPTSEAASATPARPGPLAVRRARHMARARGRARLTLRLPRASLAALAADRRLSPLLLAALLLAASVAAAPGTGVGVGNTSAREAALPAGAGIAALRGGAAADGRPSAGRDLALVDPPGTEDERPLDPPGARPASLAGPFAPDGTLMKPLAVDSRVPGLAAAVRRYAVRPGDTLTGIAHRFGLSMMTLWWANKLSAKDRLRIGQELLIPPVDGILYTVREGDSVLSIARAFRADPEAIIGYNELDGDVVVLGQQIMVPDGRGAPIAEATPEPRSSSPRPRSGSGSTGGGCSACRFDGTLRWPVAGGSISQYFHYGHYGLDIAADHGTPVLAAAAGKVVFAGWKNNGGGWQVWLSNGSNIYTGYYHMSSLAVGTGASVGRGQRIGRIGSSGWSTGPHLHFEVWIGPIWKGYRVNPLKYL